MGELLQLYLGESRRDESRAFWLGASRVIDPRPVLSGSFAAKVAEGLTIPTLTPADAWGVVGEELRDAMEHAETREQEEQGK